jgi:hypothetical protein
MQYRARAKVGHEVVGRCRVSVEGEGAQSVGKKMSVLESLGGLGWTTLQLDTTCGIVAD